MKLERVVVARSQFGSDHILAERLLGTSDALGEPENEVPFSTCSGISISSLISVILRYPLFGSGRSSRPCGLPHLSPSPSAACSSLGGLPRLDLVQGQAEVPRLLLEEALEVVAHRHAELGVDLVVPLLEPRQ